MLTLNFFSPGVKPCATDGGIPIHRATNEKHSNDFCGLNEKEEEGRLILIK